jgi:hypothetical protein
MPVSPARDKTRETVIARVPPDPQFCDSGGRTRTHYYGQLQVVPEYVHVHEVVVVAQQLLMQPGMLLFWM